MFVDAVARRLHVLVPVYGMNVHSPYSHPGYTGHSRQNVSGSFATPVADDLHKPGTAHCARVQPLGLVTAVRVNNHCICTW